MQKTFIFWCLILLGSTTAFAQNGYRPAYPLEIGLQAGTSQFLGDLGGQMGIGKGFIIDTDIKAVRPTFGIFGRYNIGGHFAARLDINYLQLAGDDKYAGQGKFNTTNRPIIGYDDEGKAIIEPAWFRYYRNLNFKTDVFDINIAAEIIPYNFELGGGYQNYSVLSPYVFIGVGLFAFNPKGFYNGAWVDLKPLTTEGQGIVEGRAPYELVQFNIPMGFGLKWIYNDTWSVALEVNHRMTFTDYIDDVSTDYVEDPTVFDQTLDAQTASLIRAIARRSQEIDPAETYGYITAPGEQRGDPKDNDSYYTVTIRFSYYIDPGSVGGSKRYGCPVW